MDNKVIVINYTGRKGGGALVAFEAAKALVECGERVIPILSDQIENLDLWRKVDFEKIILINTYHSAVSFLFESILFPIRQKRKIEKELHEYEIKAVYCPMATFWTYDINALIDCNCRVVVNHDPIPHSGANAFSMWLMNRAYRNADIVIVHSKAFIEYAKTIFKYVEYVPLGRHGMYKDVPDKKNIISYDANKINFLFFGRIGEYKGLDVLVKAYKKLEKQYEENVSLTLVVNGDFSKYADEYSDLKHFTLINRWVYDNEVESCFIGEGLINVCPYKDATQSGVVLLSYDYRVPVIATRTGGLEEQIINEKTGLLIEPNNVEQLYSAMERFVIQNDLREKMQAEIDVYNVDTSWNSIVKKIIEIINEFGVSQKFK